MRISSRIRLLCSASIAALVVAQSTSVFANPQDGTVVAGEVTIVSPNPTTLEINQMSDRAIVDWRRFDIGVGETTIFNQPTVNAWILNRVLGTDEPSKILGTLSANGNVVIVNPDGIHFGAGSRVDVNRLIATTADIENDNFMSGSLAFTKSGNPSASIVNEGTITAADYGLAALVAPAVRNSGVITARLGAINLASGNTFTIDPYGDGLVKLAIDDEIAADVVDVATGQTVTDLVKNEGTLKADGGTVAMRAVTARKAVNSVVNNTGVIEANSVGMRAGKIILGGQTAGTKTTASAPLQKVKVSGTISAKTIFPENVPVPTPAPRGSIEITGEAIEVAAATLDASGTYGGGTILIGGDYLGGNATDEVMAGFGIAREANVIPTASYVSLDAESTIHADALVNGNGGKVVVWSDVATVTAAKITARGGVEGGDGGFIETSGQYLDVRVAADTSAANGQAGTWLLDPYDMYIRDVASSTNVDDIFGDFDIGGGYTGIRVFPAGTPSVVDTDTIETALNSGTNVQIVNRGAGEDGPEAGDIYVENDINKTAGGDATLNLVSINDIILSDGVSIVSTSGKLDLRLYATSGAVIAENFGTLGLNGGFLQMAVRDGIEFHTDSSMPFLALSLGPFEDSPLAVNNYSMSFGDDTLNFSGTNSELRFTENSINLIDANSTKSVQIELYRGNIGIADNAINVTTGRDIGLVVHHNPGFFRIGTPGANGVPEVNSNGAISLEYTPGPALFVPTVEVNGVNPPICVGITCVAVNLPSPPEINPILPTSSFNPNITASTLLFADDDGFIPVDSISNRSVRVLRLLNDIVIDDKNAEFMKDLFQKGFDPGLESLDYEATIWATLFSILAYESEANVSSFLRSLGIFPVDDKYIHVVTLENGQKKQYLLAKTIVNGQLVYIISIEGTDGFVGSEEWREDAKAVSIPIADGIEFHGYFLQLAAAVQSDLYNNKEILTAVSRGEFNAQLSGHSLGGAAANILHYQLSKSTPEGASSDIATYTIGAPIVGNSKFASYVESENLNLYNIVNENDMVTSLGLGSQKLFNNLGVRAGTKVPLYSSSYISSEHTSGFYLNSLLDLMD